MRNPRLTLAYYTELARRLWSTAQDFAAATLGPDFIEDQVITLLPDALFGKKEAQTNIDALVAFYPWLKQEMPALFEKAQQGHLLLWGPSGHTWAEQYKGTLKPVTMTTKKSVDAAEAGYAAPEHLETLLDKTVAQQEQTRAPLDETAAEQARTIQSILSIIPGPLKFRFNLSQLVHLKDFQEEMITFHQEMSTKNNLGERHAYAYEYANSLAEKIKAKITTLDPSSAKYQQLQAMKECLVAALSSTSAQATATPLSPSVAVAAAALSFVAHAAATTRAIDQEQKQEQEQTPTCTPSLTS